jgi:hypothetical protein
MDELYELSPRLRELLDDSFTFDSMYDIPPKFFSPLAPHRTCICEASRIGDQLHEASPWLDGQSLVFVTNSVSYPVGSERGPPPGLSDFPDKDSWRQALREYQRRTPLPSTMPIVGEPETFGQLGTMIQSVLGPPSGEWIVVVDDENDGFVASRSSADIVRLEQVFGSGRDGAVGILDNWEAIKTHNPSWLREWLPAVLEHVLGPDVTADLLAAEGSWIADLAEEGT